MAGCPCLTSHSFVRLIRETTIDSPFAVHDCTGRAQRRWRVKNFRKPLDFVSALRRAGFRQKFVEVLRKSGNFSSALRAGPSLKGFTKFQDSRRGWRRIGRMGDQLRPPNQLTCSKAACEVNTYGQNVICEYDLLIDWRVSFIGRNKIVSTFYCGLYWNIDRN